MGRPAVYPTDPKPCVVCGTVFGPKPGEHPYTFHHRRYCGRACANVAVGRARAEVFPDRVCQTCGAPLARKPGELAFAFRKRKTCGYACCKPIRAQSVRRLKRDLGQRYCVSCGLLLERRDNESPKDFLRRKTCDRACGAVRANATRMRRHGRQSPYPPEWTTRIRPRILARDNHCCQLCGALPGKRGHHVHHIDDMKTHIADHNLVTLCPPCHAKVTRGDRPHWRAVLTALMQEDP